MTEYRVEVYDLNNKDAWQRDMIGGENNHNFNQSFVDWASRTFVVAVAESQSAFWIQRVESQYVVNNQRITLSNDGTNKLLLVYKEQRRNIDLRLQLSLKDYLQKSTTYIEFVRLKQDTESFIKEEQDKLHQKGYEPILLNTLNEELNGLKNTFDSWKIKVASIDDALNRTSVECSVAYEVSLQLNNEKMTKWLNNNHIGSNNWHHIQTQLKSDEQRFLARIATFKIQYDANHDNLGVTLPLKLPSDEISKILDEVGMPYDVDNTTLLPSDNPHEQQRIKHEIDTITNKFTQDCIDAAREITNERSKTSKAMQNHEINAETRTYEKTMAYLKIVGEMVRNFPPGTNPASFESIFSNIMRPGLPQPRSSLLNKTQCVSCQGKGVDIYGRVCVHCDGRTDTES